MNLATFISQELVKDNDTFLTSNMLFGHYNKWAKALYNRTEPEDILIKAFNQFIISKEINGELCWPGYHIFQRPNWRPTNIVSKSLNITVPESGCISYDQLGTAVRNVTIKSNNEISIKCDSIELTVDDTILPDLWIMTYTHQCPVLYVTPSQTDIAPITLQCTYETCEIPGASCYSYYQEITIDNHLVQYQVIGLEAKLTFIPKIVTSESTPVPVPVNCYQLVRRLITDRISYTMTFNHLDTQFIYEPYITVDNSQYRPCLRVIIDLDTRLIIGNLRLHNSPIPSYMIMYNLCNGDDHFQLHDYHYIDIIPHQKCIIEFQASFFFNQSPTVGRWNNIFQDQHLVYDCIVFK